MKKIILVLLVLIFMACSVKAQDKMNPDGYVNGVTFYIEPGWEVGTGEYKVRSESQNLRFDNPYLRISMFIPLSEKSTISINTGLGHLTQIGSGNNCFPADELKFTRLSISVGWKIYLKNVQ
jgi:hypothetical protein